MNREIKFRAWDGKKMNYQPIVSDGTDGGETSRVMLNEAIECFDYILMQFTGLHDKNGKEIYEGDIVIPTKLKDVPNEVKYIQHGFYRVKIHKNTDYVNPLGNCEVEVIGNIYENKELLNQ